jgi:hypothetical protein
MSNKNAWKLTNARKGERDESMLEKTCASIVHNIRGVEVSSAATKSTEAGLSFSDSAR